MKSIALMFCFWGAFPVYAETGSPCDTADTSTPCDTADTSGPTDTSDPPDTADTSDTSVPCDTSDTASPCDTGETGETGETGDTSDSGDTGTIDTVAAAELAGELGGCGCNSNTISFSAGAMGFLLVVLGTRRRGGPIPVRGQHPGTQ